MDIVQTIKHANGGAQLCALADAGGVDVSQAAAVLERAVPELAFQIERNTLSRGGLAELISALGDGHHAAYLADAEALAAPAAQTDGAGILRHILGSDEAVGFLGRRIARETGVDAAAATAMLPQVAAAMMGGVAQETRAQFGDVFSQVPDIGPRDGPPGYGRGVSRIEPREWGGETDGGGWARHSPRPAPDRGGGGGFSGQEPLPVPDGLPDDAAGRRARNPFDDLSDVIRRRGRTSTGDSAGSVVRDILGQVLGFQKGGVISWIIRFIVIRFGWRILKAILFGRR